jgi:hypothetical protein
MLSTSPRKLDNGAGVGMGLEEFIKAVLQLAQVIQKSSQALLSLFNPTVLFPHSSPFRFAEPIAVHDLTASCVPSISGAATVTCAL